MGNQAVSKDFILEKSTELFREKGYTNTSISMLAEVCEMSKSHFYYYFENKEALMEAVLRQEINYFNEKVFSWAYEEAFSPKKRLKKMFKKMDAAFCKGTTGSLVAITVFQSTREDGERFYPLIREYYDHWEKALFHIFSVKLTGKKSMRLSRSTMLQIEGSLVFLQMNDDPGPFREVTFQVLSDFKKY